MSDYTTSFLFPPKIDGDSLSLSGCLSLILASSIPILEKEERSTRKEEDSKREKQLDENYSS